jgi:hypothetical protein
MLAVTRKSTLLLEQKDVQHPKLSHHRFFFLRERQQFLDAMAAFLEISMA